MYNKVGTEQREVCACVFAFACVYMRVWVCVLEMKAWIGPSEEVIYPHPAWNHNE